MIAKKNAELAVVQKWQAVQRAAFAFASVDAALDRQRAAAAAKLEAEALHRAAEDRAAAEAAAADAAAASEHLRQARERAAAREEQLGRVRMLERQYRAKLLLRCRDQWLCFVAGAQQLRKAATAAEIKNNNSSSAEPLRDVADAAAEDAAERARDEQDSDSSRDVQRQHREEMVLNVRALTTEEENIFKRVFNSRTQGPGENAGVDSGSSEDERENQASLHMSKHPAAVAIFPEAEPEFNSLSIQAPNPSLLMSLDLHEGDGGGAFGEPTDATIEHDSAAASDAMQHGPAATAQQFEHSQFIVPETAHAALQDSPSAQSSGQLENMPTSACDNGTHHFHNPNQESPASSSPISDISTHHPESPSTISCPSPAHVAQALPAESRDSAAVRPFTGQQRPDAPKTPPAPLLTVQHTDAASANAPASPSGSGALFSVATPDAESRPAAVQNRVGPKTPLSPLLDVVDLTRQRVSVSNLFPAVVHDGSAALHQPPASFKIGPKTPLTPASPARHVRQWLMREQLQGPELVMNQTAKPPEPFFIRRSSKPQTVFHDIPSPPSLAHFSTKEHLSSTVPPSLEPHSFLGNTSSSLSLNRDRSLVHPSFFPSDAGPSGTHKPSAPEPSAPVPRLPHGPRSSHQPGKQHDKSDSLSIYRAGLLRELDSDLRGQWPHSFQRTVQVCALEHFFFLCKF